MIKDTVLEVFQHMHEHPELSFQEVETTNYLVDKLTTLDFSPQRFENITNFMLIQVMLIQNTMSVCVQILMQSIKK